MSVKLGWSVNEAVLKGEGAWSVSSNDAGMSAARFIVGRAPGLAAPGVGRAQRLSPITLTSYSGIERQPTFSPDGSKVAFVWNGEKEDNADIYIKQIGSTAAPMRLTTSPASDELPAWSPNDP